MVDFWMEPGLCYRLDEPEQLIVEDCFVRSWFYNFGTQFIFLFLYVSYIHEYATWNLHEYWARSIKYF